MILRWNATRSGDSPPFTASALTRRCYAQCDYPYHLKCLDPPLDAVPDGEWFCPECEADPGAPVSLDGVRRKPKAKKAKHDDGDASPKPGQKRKGAPQAGGTFPVCPSSVSRGN